MANGCGLEKFPIKCRTIVHLQVRWEASSLFSPS